MSFVDRLLMRVEAAAEDGQVLVEYALILAAVAVVCVGLVTSIGIHVSDLYNQIGTLFP
jgi:Flp pilus assembly pilin Flp